MKMISVYYSMIRGLKFSFENTAVDFLIYKIIMDICLYHTNVFSIEWEISIWMFETGILKFLHDMEILYWLKLSKNNSAKQEVLKKWLTILDRNIIL